MAAPKKPSTKARPKASNKVAKKAPQKAARARTSAKATAKPRPAKPSKAPTPSSAETRPAGRAASGTKKAARGLGAKDSERKVATPTSRPVRAAAVPPLRRPMTGTPVPNRAPSIGGSADRQTPLANRAPVELVPEVAGFRPSRILTTRPRPVIRQIDPTGVDESPARTLHPWEIEVDDLAELMAARAAEEKAAEQMNAHFVTTESSAQARIAEARAAGWKDDARPSGGLSDARVRLVNPDCKFMDGKSIRDVSLSVHVPSGRATLLIEGGPRLRAASFRMREDESLPDQLGKLLEDPMRFARAEHSSGRDLLAQLEELDRSAVVDLRKLARDDLDPERLAQRLRAYVAVFAAAHAAFGLPVTVDAVWDRFGGRRGSVLEQLALADDARQLVADAFDGALDGLPN